MQDFEPIKSLPAKYAVVLGRISVLWAETYWRSLQIVYLLLAIDQKQGRVAVREPRASDISGVIADLLELKKMKVSFNLKDFGKLLTTCEDERNLYTHGVWITKSRQTGIFVQRTSGVWESNTPIQGRKRRLTPQAIPTTLRKLETLKTNMETALSIAKDMYMEIYHELNP